MKKRLVCLFLALILLAVCALPACSKESKPNKTRPATTEPKETEATPMAKDPVRDPAEDGTLNILMVGNSFCYYYVEELYDLLTEHLPQGINQINIYNLYYSGCNLTQHLNWWVGNEANYDLFKTSAVGRQKMNDSEGYTLEEALAQADWDYISLQGTVKGASYMSDDREALCQATGELAAPLLNRFHEVAPGAQLLWHRTWFSEIGRVSNGHTYTAEDGPKYNKGMQQICDYMCGEFCEDKPYDLIMVNSGAAWTEARALNETLNLLPYGGLCARLGKNGLDISVEHSGDGYHDGDIGGAQLLNAYMWYMTITGDTDLSDNNYAPSYTYNGQKYILTQELIDMLKQAAMTVAEKQVHKSES